MGYQVTIQKSLEQSLAVKRGRATLAELPQTIPALSKEVYAFLKTVPGMKKPGFNIAVYYCGPGADLMKPPGAPIDVGVLVDAPFQGDGNVVCSALPPGTVATTIHYGPYQKLGEAHAAIHQWLRENGKKSTGTSWEIYGHWNDDPVQLRTDIFYLLQ